MDAIDWPSRSTHLWDVLSQCICHHQVVPQIVQELTDALIQVWEEIPCPPRTPSAVSSGACPDIVKSVYRHVGAINTTESHYELSSVH